VNIRELIEKWENEVKGFKDRNYNFQQAERTYCGSLERCIRELKQCLSDCEIEVDKEIKHLSTINESMPYIEEWIDGVIKALEKTKKIYGGDK
jgi:hypothetical protein